VNLNLLAGPSIKSQTTLKDGDLIVQYSQAVVGGDHARLALFFSRSDQTLFQAKQP
jgi:hypothetical protein